MLVLFFFCKFFAICNNLECTKMYGTCIFYILTDGRPPTELKYVHLKNVNIYLFLLKTAFKLHLKCTIIFRKGTLDVD